MKSACVGPASWACVGPMKPKVAGKQKGRQLALAALVCLPADLKKNRKFSTSDCCRFPIRRKNESVWNEEQKSWFVWLHFPGTVHGRWMGSRCCKVLRKSSKKARSRFFPEAVSSSLVVLHMFLQVPPLLRQLKASFPSLPFAIIVNFDFLCLRALSFKCLLFTV